MAGEGEPERGAFPVLFWSSGERAFVLVPLSDLFPLHEGLGYSFHDAFEAVDKSGVYLYK